MSAVKTVGIFYVLAKCNVVIFKDLGYFFDGEVLFYLINLYYYISKIMV